MPANDKRSLPRVLLCQLLTGDPKAGLLLDCIVGWHPHAKLLRKGRRGRWSAFSLAALCRDSGLTPKQLRRARPLLEGYALIESGGFQGKRTLFTQPTALTTRFVQGKYPTKAAALKALSALRQAADQDPQQSSKQMSEVPLGTAPGHHQRQNQGQDPIQPLHPFQSLPKNKESEASSGKEGKVRKARCKQLDEQQETKYKANTLGDSAQQSVQSASAPKSAPESEQISEGKTDAELYPEFPIPKGCPIKHPREWYGKRWATFSPELKAKLYAWVRGPCLENWKAKNDATKHTGAESEFKFPKHLLEDDDPALAELDTELAKTLAALDDSDETT